MEEIKEPTPHAIAPPNGHAVTAAQTIARKPVGSATPQPRSSRQTSSRPTFLSRARRQWSWLPLWKKILIIAVPIALLALILGLAIGLTRGSGTQNLPLPSNHGGPYTGDLTYYMPGLGACGITSSSSDSIVAVSHTLFDAAQTGSDPNSNPLCGKKLRVKRYKEGSGERSVDLTVVDRCVGCKSTDIDTTTSVFEKLADIDLGRVTATWSWLD